MPMKITIDQKQTGPTLTLPFTVVTKDDDLEPTMTEPIIVNALAMVYFKFQYVLKGKYTLVSRILLKKMEKAKSSTVKICVTCENLNQEWVCPNDWADYELASKERDSYEHKTISCSLEVNITVQESRPIVIMQSLKLCEDTEFTDFQLQAEDGAVAVHKCVMSIHSEMFKKMLSGDWKETAEGFISLAGLTVQTLQHLKDYMYMGNLPDDGLEMLLLLADCYMIDNLKAVCIRKMVETVTSANIDNLIEFACQKNMPDLIRALLYNFPRRIANGFYQLEADTKQENEKNN